MEQFLASVEKRAYQMAKFATGCPDQALEIVQETMYKLVEKYSDRDREEWGPLFHTILQSRIKDWHRRNSIKKKLGLFWSGNSDGNNAMEDRVDPSAFDPARMLEGEQVIERLETAIGSLPLRQQQAFLLRYWEEYDVSQTAMIMGCSEGSVKTHCSRALAVLREKVRDCI